MTQVQMPDDLTLARQAKLRPILELARELGLAEDEVEPYGRYAAKVRLEAWERRRERPDGKLILVTAVTPTPLGEGKTTVAIGLAQALNRLGKRAFVNLRQPSLGPVFGIKGGAAGGGYAQVVPMELVNLHLTGDFHAVTAAHNLLAAFLDNHLHHGNALGIDVRRLLWNRVLDLSDRALRRIVLGLGGTTGGIPREGRFDITAASEVMSILSLTSGYMDLRGRLGKIVVGFTRDGEAVTAEDLRAAGAMAVLLKDALLPNLLQTLEGTPAFLHTGPFGNVATAVSSLIADRIALKLADYVVTEAGFGADLGAEKFVHLKCRQGGLVPYVAVLVATVRALKAHSGRWRIRPGRPLPPELLEENLEALAEGIGNLEKQIENVRRFGLPVVVAVNRFPTDTERELEFVRERALAAGAVRAEVADVHARGGEGGEALARAVMDAARRGVRLSYLYEMDWPAEKKMEALARELYGARKVEWTADARRQLRRYERLGYGHLPLCVAKTHLSLSADPKLVGRPEGFTVTVREVRLAAGAGFLIPLLNEIQTMPGLPARPAGERMDLLPDGTVVGLF